MNEEKQSSNMLNTTPNTNARVMDETRDILDHMKELERSTYKRPLRVLEPFRGQWRKQTIEWMYTITSFCGLRQEAVAAAVYYLDASVSKGLIQTAVDYQVASMTAFHLGLKVHDSPSIRMVKLESLVKLGSGGFGEQEVTEMETKMLFALEWRMHPPTANGFLYQYLKLLPPTTSSNVQREIKKTAMGLIEAVMSTDYFSIMESSTLAYAALLLAIDMVPPDRFRDVDGDFLSCMTEVTRLNSNSQILSRCILILDCISKDQAIPRNELDVSSFGIGDSTKKSDNIVCQQSTNPLALQPPR